VSCRATPFQCVFLAYFDAKKYTLKQKLAVYCQPAHNQLKSQKMFHENSSPNDLYSVTFALTYAGRKLMAFSAYPVARRCLLRRPSGPNRPQWPPTSRCAAATTLPEALGTHVCVGARAI
jgi:hypothetical protein